jgi:hypothetical protein
MYIYILELEQNKYYIGKSNNVNERFLDHCNGYGSKWTKLYKPIRIINIINYTKFEEDRQVLIYMEMYGIGNVRGGVFSKINLSRDDYNYIYKYINSENDVCYRCKRKGHFINNCYAKTDINNKLLVKKECLRCGRSNHIETECYAIYDVNNMVIEERKSCCIII